MNLPANFPLKKVIITVVSVVIVIAGFKYLHTVLG